MRKGFDLLLSKVKFFENLLVGSDWSCEFINNLLVCRCSLFQVTLQLFICHLQPIVDLLWLFELVGEQHKFCNFILQLLVEVLGIFDFGSFFRQRLNLFLQITYLQLQIDILLIGIFHFLLFLSKFICFRLISLNFFKFLIEIIILSLSLF